MGEELSAANAAYQKWSDQQGWGTDYASFIAGWLAGSEHHEIESRMESDR